MTESGVFYSAAQLSRMKSDITAASNALHSGNYTLVTTDLEDYYAVQTETVSGYAYRGYATEALQVLENTGFGIIANQEVKLAIGSSNDTPAFQAQLEFDLASTDDDQITTNNNQVPTLTEDEQDHAAVFPILGLSIEDWGGTPQAAFGEDFTEGAATAAEENDMAPPSSIATLTPSELQESLYNLMGASVQAVITNPLGVGLLQIIPGIGLLENLQDQIDSLPYTSSLQKLNFNTFSDGSAEAVESSSSSTSILTFSASTSTEAEGAISESSGIVNVQGTVTDLSLTNDTVRLGTSTYLDLSGNNNLIEGQGSDTFILNGNGDTLEASAGFQISNGTINVTGDNETISVGPDETINLGTYTGITINGSNENIYGGNGVTATVNGSENQLYGGTSANYNVSGNGNIVSMGSGSYAGILSGASNQVTASNSSIGGANGIGVNVTGNDDVANLLADETVGWNGSGNTFNVGVGSTLNGGGSGDILNAGSGTYVGLLGGSNYQVNMSNGSLGAYDNTSFTLTGSSNIANLGTDENVGWNGSGNTFNTGTESTLNGSGDNDTANAGIESYVGLQGGSGNVINASSVTIGASAGSAFTVNGNDDTANLPSNMTVSWNGSGNTFNAGTGSTLNGAGGSDTVNAGAGSSIGLAGGAGYTVNTSSSTVVTQTNTGFTLNGNDDIGTLQDNNTVSWTGSGNTFTAGSGSTFNGGGSNDVVNTGSGSYVGLLGGSGYTVNSANSTVATWANTSFNVEGGNDTVNGANGDYIGVLGGAGYEIYTSSSEIETPGGTFLNVSGSNNNIGLGGVGNQLGLLSGSGNQVTGLQDLINTLSNVGANFSGGDLTIVAGSGSYLGILGGSGYVVSLNNGAIQALANSGLNLVGQGDVVNVGNNSYLGLLNSSANDVVYQSNGVLATQAWVTLSLNGTNDVTHFAANNYVTVNGTNITENSGTGTTANISGQQDPFYGSSDVVNYFGSNYGDVVYGSSDSGSDWGYDEPDDGADDYSDYPILGSIEFFQNYTSYDGFSEADGISAAAVIQAEQEEVGGASVSSLPSSEASGANSAKSSLDGTTTASQQFAASRWATKTITWYVNTSDAGGEALPATVESTLQQAMADWASASGLTLQEVFTPDKADIQFNSYDFDPVVTGQLGLTTLQSSADGFISKATILLENPNETALVQNTSGQLAYSDTGVTLLQTALHEIGHALGLADSSDPGSIMYYALGASNANLDTTDIQNVSSLYPQPNLFQLEASAVNYGYSDHTLEISGSGNVVSFGAGSNILSDQDSAEGNIFLLGSGNTQLTIAGINDQVFLNGGSTLLVDQGANLTVHLSSAKQTLELADFSATKGLVIVLDGGFLSPADAASHLRNEGNGNAVLHLSGGGSIQFDHIAANQISSDHFVITH